MASKKGVVITGVILGAIAAASFMVWLVPHDRPAAISVSDFAGHLEGVKSIHGVLADEIDSSFQKYMNGQITADEYNEMARVTTTQINSQIMRLVDSGAPEEWYRSYIAYMDALKAQNSKIRESMVVVDAIESGRNAEDGLGRMGQIEQEVQRLVAESDENLPA